jgi:hypothetical protein
MPLFELTSYYPWETQPSNQTNYESATVIAFLFAALIIGVFVGYGVGSAIAGSNYAEAQGHQRLAYPFPVSGNVSIGSLGVPRGITFDSGGLFASSMVTSLNGSPHYQVWLSYFQSYVVTIFYQDSVGNWQQCMSKQSPFGGGGPITQNFFC